MTLAVLLTCHNRREKTLACLRSLFDALEGVVQFEVFMVDDGSTDGTAVAVGATHPRVRVIKGDGSLFWCRGMHQAWREALDGEFRGYLWVNDDVVFSPGALRTFVQDAQRYVGGAGNAVVVGSVTDPDSGQLSYGGSVRVSTWHPGRLKKVEPLDAYQEIDTFNGNVVLVPHSVVEQIGTIDPAFSHAIGDIDYGLRARAACIRVLLAPGTVGTCRRNPSPSLNVRQMLSRKGLPWRDWMLYTRRHGDWRWPVAFLMPYVRSMLSGFSTSGGRTSEHEQEQ